VEYLKLTYVQVYKLKCDMILNSEDKYFLKKQEDSMEIMNTTVKDE
jgi:hypothetical protein